MVGSSPAAALPLAPALMRRWGIGHDGLRGVLFLAPQVSGSEAESACPPFRAGRSVIRLRLRRRPSTVVLGVEIAFGPPLRVEVDLPLAPVGGAVLVDGEPVAGPRVAFEARGAHEIQWPAEPPHAITDSARSP